VQGRIVKYPIFVSKMILRIICYTVGLPERTVRHAGSERAKRLSSLAERKKVRDDKSLLPPTFNECCIGRKPGEHNAVHVPWGEKARGDGTGTGQVTGSKMPAD
jgi:hypothetical protein